MNDILERAILLVTEAGSYICQSARACDQPNLEYMHKSSIGDLVTSVDLDVQNRLSKVLLELLPNSHILGEEAKSPDSDLGGIVWILDPVDGTTNLVHGLPYVAISLALYDSGLRALGLTHCAYSKNKIRWGYNQCSAPR